MINAKGDSIRKAFEIGQMMVTISVKEGIALLDEIDTLHKALERVTKERDSLLEKKTEIPSPKKIFNTIEEWENECARVRRLADEAHRSREAGYNSKFL